MRIAIIAPYYPPKVGGVERHVERLGTELARRGHAVDVFCAADRNQVEEVGGVTVHRFRSVVPGRAYPFAPGLWRELHAKRRSYDVFHAHSYHSVAAFAPASIGVQPFVFTPHYIGSDETATGRVLHGLYRPFGRLIVSAASRLVCMSIPERLLLEASFPRVSGRICVIPNGVDAEAILAASPIAADGKVLLAAGRLEPYKRFDRIVDAATELPPEWRLVVIGDGSDVPRLRNIVAERRMSERVRFLGMISEPPTLFAWFRRADVFVSMSPRENFGITPLEASTAGAAVVTSDIPAHRYAATLAEGSNWRFVPLDTDGDALAATILAADGAGRAVATVPSWTDVAERTEALYREVIAEQNAPSA
jgi:glycosyltransferase involved in cell wall biosynthesis